MLAAIKDLWDTVEFNLRFETSNPNRRRARLWGIVYATRPGETPDPEDPTEPEQSNNPTPPANP